MALKNRETTASTLTTWLEKPIITWSVSLRLESYLKPLIPQITTALLLFHLVVGCCFHHAHACVMDCCDAPAAKAEDCCHHGEEAEGTDTAPLGHDGHEDDQHECDGGICVFMAADTDSDLLDSAQSQVCWLGTANTPEANPFGLMNGPPPPLWLLGDDGPRVHLLFQVMLI